MDSSRMTQTLVIDALKAVYWKKKPAPDLLHYSDRDSQYCSAAYRALQASIALYRTASLLIQVGDSIVKNSESRCYPVIGPTIRF